MLDIKTLLSLLALSVRPWLNWIEHLTTDQEVWGSNPYRRAIIEFALANSIRKFLKELYSFRNFNCFRVFEKNNLSAADIQKSVIGIRTLLRIT